MCSRAQKKLVRELVSYIGRGDRSPPGSHGAKNAMRVSADQVGERSPGVEWHMRSGKAGGLRLPQIRAGERAKHLTTASNVRCLTTKWLSFPSISLTKGPRRRCSEHSRGGFRGNQDSG